MGSSENKKRNTLLINNHESLHIFKGFKLQISSMRLINNKRYQST